MVSRKAKSGEVYPAVPNEELTMEGTTDYNVQLIVQYTSAAGKKLRITNITT